MNSVYIDQTQKEWQNYPQKYGYIFEGSLGQTLSKSMGISTHTITTDS